MPEAAAASLDRKVCLVGRSMSKYVNVARSLGIMDVPELTLTREG